MIQGKTHLLAEEYRETRSKVTFVSNITAGDGPAACNFGKSELYGTHFWGNFLNKNSSHSSGLLLLKNYTL